MSDYLDTISTSPPNSTSWADFNLLADASLRMVNALPRPLDDGMLMPCAAVCLHARLHTWDTWRSARAQYREVWYEHLLKAALKVHPYAVECLGVTK
jgi:hypothetical protein